VVFLFPIFSHQLHSSLFDSSSHRPSPTDCKSEQSNAVTVGSVVGTAKGARVGDGDGAGKGVRAGDGDGAYDGAYDGAAEGV